MPSPFQGKVAYSVKPCYCNTSSVLRTAKVNGKKGRSSSGPLGDRLCKIQARFALGGQKAVVSGIAGQEGFVLIQKSRYKARILTQILSS